MPSVDDRLDRKHNDETKKDVEANASFHRITITSLLFKSILPGFEPPLMHVRCHCLRGVLVARKQ